MPNSQNAFSQLDHTRPMTDSLNFAILTEFSKKMKFMKNSASMLTDPIFTHFFRQTSREVNFGYDYRLSMNFGHLTWDTFSEKLTIKTPL